MSKTKLSFALRCETAAHFHFRCAYCQSQEAVLGMRFTVDHIIPEILGGASDPQNLCLACWDCNLTKGSRIAALEPQTQSLVPLFHPRKERWEEHFEWHYEGLIVTERTTTGRVTINALELNRDVLVEARTRWMEVGWHPPS